jgi:hypothetical protein
VLWFILSGSLHAVHTQFIQIFITLKILWRWSLFIIIILLCSSICSLLSLFYKATGVFLLIDIAGRACNWSFFSVYWYDIQDMEICLPVSCMLYDVVPRLSCYRVVDLLCPWALKLLWKYCLIGNLYPPEV